MTRGTRTERVQAERRRRDDGSLDRMYEMKLAVPPQFANDTEYQYRWVNDADNRVHFLSTYDDWDVVTSEKTEASGVDALRRPVGTKTNGHPLEAVLMRKRVEFVRADAEKAEAKRKAQERQLVTATKTDEKDTRSEAVSYVPAGNSITSGPYSP